MTKFYSNMYGGDARVAPTIPGREKKEAPAPKYAAGHKQLSGLKISGSHIKRIDVGDQLIDVPSAEYVKLLEKQIRELRQQLRNNENATRRVTNSMNKVLNELERVKAELKNKIDMR